MTESLSELREMLSRAVCLGNGCRRYGDGESHEYCVQHEDGCHHTVDIILAAIKANGMVIVPVDPTDAMIADGRCPPVDVSLLALEANQANSGRYGTDIPVTIAYRAMLSASPYWLMNS